MADKITWNDKVSLVTDPTIAEINKVTDANMNEIKSVTNTNADQLDETIVYDENDITTNTKALIKRGNYRYYNSEISNEYGTATNIGYSQAYINKFTNYSTTEQVIGKWINGKPIYRKVIESTTFTTDYYYIGLDVESFVNQYGWVQRKDYPRLWQYIPSRVGDPMSISFLATDTSQGVKVDWGSNWQSQYATLFNKIVIVVEYTKTTD